MLSGGRRRTVVGVALGLMSLAAACGGSDDGGERAIVDDQVVIDPDAVAAARERAENEAEIDEATATVPPATDGGSDDADVDVDASVPTTLAVAEAEEDELDTLLNSLTVFNQCLAEDGFEFIGAPGIAGATADQFEEPYIQSLGKCATSSDVVRALEDFGAAQENRTPEEIAAFNFGLPVFRECMIARGWEIGELVPDESGALTFGDQLAPPAGTDGFGTDDVADCRLEAEQYVADNFESDTSTADA